MYCQKCQTSIPDNCVFCPHCGNRVVAFYVNDRTPTTEEIPLNGGGPQPMQQNTYQSNNYQNNTQQPYNNIATGYNTTPSYQPQMQCPNSLNRMPLPKEIEDKVTASLVLGVLGIVNAIGGNVLFSFIMSVIGLCIISSAEKLMPLDPRFKTPRLLNGIALGISIVLSVLVFFLLVIIFAGGIESLDPTVCAKMMMSINV